jgi:hypothetical protein
VPKRLTFLHLIYLRVIPKNPLLFPESRIDASSIVMVDGMLMMLWSDWHLRFALYGRTDHFRVRPFWDRIGIFLGRT